MNKQSYIGVIVSLMLLISSMVLTQNKKETAQRNNDTLEIITQKDTSLTTESSKLSFGQQSIIFLTNSDKAKQLNQIKINNNAIINLKTSVDSSSADTVNASQMGDYNRIYFYNLPDTNSTFRQVGSGNSVVYIQRSDSLKTTKSKAEVRQSGKGNSAVIIQN